MSFAPDEIVWAEPERQTRAVKEYLAALEAEVEPNPDRKPPDRYLNDAASFCDVQTAYRASPWLPNSATMNTRLASGVADF